MFARLALFAFFVLASLLGPAAAQAQEKPRFVMVTHGAPTDLFWASVKSGADQAAADMAVDLVYRAPDTFDLEAMAKLLTEAAAEKPAGVIASIPNADALATPLRAVVDAGIPLITINSGFDIASSLGSMLHVGQSEYEAGRAAGAEMRELGGRKALCINHELGNVALDLRCKGFIDAFGGSVEVLSVEPDPAKAKDAIAERLAGDAALDVVIALSATVAGEPAVAVAAELDRPVRVATFDVTDTILRAVADGSAAFAVDQQPFLQGYLPVQYLVLLARQGVIPVASVSTGPRLLDAEAAARRLQVAEPKPE